jgi:polar amino acid transport system substrate-binding protein
MRKYGLLSALLFALIILSACSQASVPAPTAEPTAELTPEATEPAETVKIPQCGDQPAGELPDLEGREITMAVENAYPPFNSIDEETSEGIGWDYDAGREICKRLNCTPVFQEAAWDGIFPAMAAGEYDMLFDGVTYTADRDASVDFSCAYVTIEQVLLVRSDESRFATPEEFKANADLKVATQINTTNEMVAQEFVGTDRVQSFEDFPIATQALLAGDVDGVVVDRFTATGLSNKNEGKLKIVFGLASDEQLSLVFQPASDLVDPVDAALNAMAADGTLQQINEKWFIPE